MKRTLQTILIAISVFFSLIGVYCLFGSPKLFYSSIGDIIYNIPFQNYKRETSSLRKELARSETEKQNLSSNYEKRLNVEKSKFDDYKKTFVNINMQVMKNCLNDLINVNADFIKKITVHSDSSDIINIDTNTNILCIKSSKHVIYQEKLGCYFAMFQIKKAVPVLEIKKGSFSFWKIYGIVNDSTGFALFSLLINENLMRIIKRDFLMDMAGMSFYSSSPTNRYFTMDYGCCPGVRGLEIFDEFGNSIHKSGYVEEDCYKKKCTPFWSGDTLIYWKPVKQYNKWDDSVEIVKLCGKLYLEATYLKKTKFYKNHEIISNISKAYCF